MISIAIWIIAVFPSVLDAEQPKEPGRRMFF